MINKNQAVINPGCTPTPTYHHMSLCWSAIFAGAFVGVGLGFLLHLFSIAIGLSAYSSTTSGAEAIAIGGFIGIVIGVIVSMGAAGFVAGYLGRLHHCYCHGGVIYGFVTWSFALIVTAAVVTPVTNYVSLYKNSLAPSVIVTTVETSNKGSSVTTNSKSDKSVKLTSQKNATITSTELAWMGWLVFVLFFIGAFASCVGACWGMCCKRVHPGLYPETPTSNL